MMMIKQEELQNNRIDYQFGDKKVVVVESHNYVLPVWAEYCSTLKKEYRLITLDYHMDTRPIFSQYAYQACNGDMAKVNEYTVQRKIYDNYIKHKYDTNKIEELSEKYVYHDEHISVGYNLEYILDLYCICKEKQDFSDGYKHYYVIGEDTDLNKFYNVAKQKEYILDIDLDFLNSENDFVKYRDIIINLIKGTDIITIAREHSYFNFLRDNIEWTNDIALQKILNLLEVI